MPNSLPKKQGMYDPQFEHDSCGIGFIANIKGNKSHKIITDAIGILKRLAHRGGVGSEPDTGDGAGILIQIPHSFMSKVCLNEDIKLPKEGEYAVGMLFLSPDAEKRQESILKLREIFEDEGLKFLGIREVPTYADCVGKSAREAMPRIIQVFAEKSSDIEAGTEFERKLFVVLKRAEKEIRYCKNNPDEYFYFTSLSSKTIVYKGMLTPDQLSRFYLDLMDIDMNTAIALVHSRFSTNTFPSWERAHPNRYIIHNGEINTIRGNINKTKARQAMFDESSKFGKDIEKIFPVINEDGSDSAMLDNYIHMLSLAGFSLPQAIMMAIPEPWEHDERIDGEKKAFYEYNSCTSEPWDGPAAIGFTDGVLVGATLDRNGLRPARYYVTKDDYVILSSEVGVVDIPDESIVKKERLHPGKMLLIDTSKGIIIEDEEIKSTVKKLHPYAQWLEENLIKLDDIKTNNLECLTWKGLISNLKSPSMPRLSKIFEGKENNYNESLPLLTRQKAFGYTWEDVDMTIKETAQKGSDPIGAMGTDIPLAAFSERPQLLYNYFKQLFAQVTNPPIDSIREKVVTSTLIYLGGEKNLLRQDCSNCRRIRADSPILSNEQLRKLRGITIRDFKSVTLPILYNSNDGENPLSRALENLFEAADIAVENGCNIIILSDKGVNKSKIAIPALLAASGLHHHLINKGTRMKTSIILETGEPREVHHFAVLIGYGVNAINPYLVYETIASLSESGAITLSAEDGIKSYINAVTDGIVKIMSKMGISTIQSYQGAQIFEALGVSESVVDKFFTGTVTRIGGITMKQIDEEAQARHKKAFDLQTFNEALETGGEYKWRRNGEYHMFNPETVYKLQMACRTGNYKLFKEYAKLMNDEENHSTIRSMLDLRTNQKPIHMDEVEPVESIVKRFKTGAMSYGSISLEAHQCMAIAMNRLGGKSNSGEGGENPDRFIPDKNGDSRCSAIKQVASGRFGVTIDYLQNAKEIQIKMAQGAKPGEGGHLPGKKVYPWIAKARNSTAGVDLISPPPHHDIYSIEDLAQLVHDLKNANRDARISVKLVSEAGVGTIAVGVAKSRADVILISGYDGGTGAAPRTSIRHAGLPWELGVAEVHQALLMNNLRNRVVIETDGKLLTGRDVAVAALLGAEEFGFATGPLIAMGCVMMRVCNLDTCPVGVATQNPVLRERFAGKPEYVENFMKFIAQDLREWMARLGFRTINEMIGHVEKLAPKKVVNKKSRTADLSGILYQPKICSNDSERYATLRQDHELERTLDVNALIRLCEPAITSGKKVSASLEITNVNRVCGTILSSEIARRKGRQGLPDDTINLKFVGSAGQSFAAFLAPGITFTLVGDSNDYIGKGLSGGKIIVVPPEKSKFKASENVIIGNVAFMGAVSGEAYIKGIAGERFCVRNSGINAVVEGIGENGCEYMTGGRVVILGELGRNFAAGMSGGIAYVYNKDGRFYEKYNKTSNLEISKVNGSDSLEVRKLIENHYKYTKSETAKRILDGWNKEIKKFIKVIPKAYREVTEAFSEAMARGLSEKEAEFEAFIKVSGGVING